MTEPRRTPAVGAAPLWAALVALLALLAPAGTASAAGTPYAPVDRPGPRLSVPAAALRSSLVCEGSWARSAPTPVLLVPGTTLDPTTDFGWNWERALRAQHRTFCTVALPGNAMRDVQVAGEYVVHAIRAMHRRAERRIDVVGHSQGGMVPRWALRFWPGTRRMVDDVVGLSPSNHGTVDAQGLCALPRCPAAFWQQRTGAAFLEALNSVQETFPGISYTDVYTHTDEVVVPNLGPAASSALHGGGGRITNVAIQDVCPLDLTEHLGIGTYDNTAYRLAMDALDHAGPARPARLPASVCARPLMPGVRPATFPTDFAHLLTVVATTIATAQQLPAEPPVACYAFRRGCRA